MHKTSCLKCGVECRVGEYIYRDGMSLCFPCHEDLNNLIGKWLDNN